MIALTVQQPFAWAIIHGGKDVENRTGLARWRRAAGERIAIHAGLAWHESGAAHIGILDALQLDEFDVARRTDPRFEFGAIIGTVLVVDVHVAGDSCRCDPWGQPQFRDTASHELRVHLELARPRPCAPIPYRGALGLWRVPPLVALDLKEATR